MKRWPDPQRSKQLTEIAGGDVEVEWGSDQKVLITCTLTDLDAILDNLHGEADHDECVDVDELASKLRDAELEGRDEGYEKGHAAALDEVRQLAGAA